MKPIKDMTNAEVDAAVLNVIAQGWTTFGDMTIALNARAEHRMIDRSLQRLRKANKAAFVDRRWCVR